jgi:Methyltransferase domain
MNSTNHELWQYLRHGKKEIEGWLQRIDAEIYGSILDFQKAHHICGGCCEIGVHHGKSFLPLCVSLKEGERVICIDLFDDQDRNLDMSGHGDYDRFIANLSKYSIDLDRVCILKASSEDISPGRIKSEVGNVRFFSIDGGHRKEIVTNDLVLAEKSLAEWGVIALDDYCRTDWPDVTAGLVSWLDTTTSGIVPFAIGSNKIYLCHKGHHGAYRAALKTDFLSNFYRKSYFCYGVDLDTYRIELIEQDEDSFKGLSKNVIRIFFPDLFVSTKKTYRSIKRLLEHSSTNNA